MTKACKKFVRQVAIALLVICLGLLGRAIYSKDLAHGQMQASTPIPTAVAEAYKTYTYLDSSGMKMTYYLFMPRNYHPQQKYPLVLVLQGGGERANPKATPEQNRTLLLKQYYAQVWVSPAIQEKWPSFIVIPQVVSQQRFVNVPGSTGSYTLAAQPSASLRLAKEIVDALQHEYQGIDSHRLYVTGLSMGGYGTWEAVERWPDYFAAAAPLSGAGDPSKAALLVDMPIWAFHGAKDTDVPVSGSRDMIQAIIKAGGHPRYTEYPNANHDLWSPGKVYSPTADPAFFTWLFSQKRP